MKPNYQSDQNDSQDNLDRLLDAALSKYAAVEPRVGLEERVLAHLNAEQSNASTTTWWRWGLAGAVAVVAIVAILTWKPSKTPQRVIANFPPITNQAPFNPAAKDSIEDGNKFSAKKPMPTRKPAVQRPLTATMVTAPKLDVFPSPHPLSAEELALARYVRNFPADAKVVAEAQANSEREVLAQMQALAHGSSESN